MIGLRAGKELTAAIDAWAESRAVKRSEAMRQLIELGLTANEAPAVKGKK
jgi:hypothetical protein